MTKGDFKWPVLYGAGMFLGAGICTGIASFAARRAVVERYQIEENTVNSAVIACCCWPCSNVQTVSKIAEANALGYSCAAMRPARPMAMQR